MTPAQCRAARGLLDWTQEKLAERRGSLQFRPWSSFERSGRAVAAGAVPAMKRTLDPPSSSSPQKMAAGRA